MSKEEIKQQTETLQEKPAEIKASEEHVQDKEPDAETVAYVKGLNPIDDIFFKWKFSDPNIGSERHELVRAEAHDLKADRRR